MKTILVLAAAASTLVGVPAIAAEPRPTVVLVHGAFAESASWNGVIRILKADGYPVVAVANPLRSVAGDARAVGQVVASIAGPVVLVGHSYGGMVISATDAAKPNVRALVYVSAFAPSAGETALGLTGRFPGSTLGSTLAPAVPAAEGGNDLFIRQDRFPEQFAADVAQPTARLMAATQRPIRDAALNEPATQPAWGTLPTWFVYGDQDRNIPPAALAYMAERAHSRGTTVVNGASHVVMVSNARAVAQTIERAAIASEVQDVRASR